MSGPDGINSSNNENTLDSGKLYLEYLDNLDGKIDNKLFGKSIFDSPDIKKEIEKYREQYNEAAATQLTQYESCNNEQKVSRWWLNPKCTSFIDYLKNWTLRKTQTESKDLVQNDLSTKEIAKFLKESTPIDSKEKAEQFVKYLLQINNSNYLDIIDSTSNDNDNDDFILRSIESSAYFDQETKDELLDFANSRKYRNALRTANNIKGVEFELKSLGKNLPDVEIIRNELNSENDEIFSSAVDKINDLKNEITFRDGVYTPDSIRQVSGVCLTCAAFNSLAHKSWGKEYLDKIFEKSAEGIIKIPSINAEIEVSDNDIVENLKDSAVGDADLMALLTALHKSEAKDINYGLKNGSDGATIEDFAKLFFSKEEAYQRSFIINDGHKPGIARFGNEKYYSLSELAPEERYKSLLKVFNDKDSKCLLIAEKDSHALSIKSMSESRVILGDSNNPNHDIVVRPSEFLTKYTISGIQFD